MRGFEERRQAGETQLVYHQALEFRARAMGAKMLGVWAAELMGQEGETAVCYAEDLVRAGVLAGDPVERVRADMRSAGFAPGDRALRLQYDMFLDEARATIATL
ncbi:MAG: ATPase inhibitor subunit zeta [Pseudomonadota bacterium]